MRRANRARRVKQAKRVKRAKRAGRASPSGAGDLARGPETPGYSKRRSVAFPVNRARNAAQSSGLIRRIRRPPGAVTTRALSDPSAILSRMNHSLTRSARAHSGTVR